MRAVKFNLICYESVKFYFWKENIDLEASFLLFWSCNQRLSIILNFSIVNFRVPGRILPQLFRFYNPSSRLPSQVLRYLQIFPFYRLWHVPYYFQSMTAGYCPSDGNQLLSPSYLASHLPSR